MGLNRFEGVYEGLNGFKEGLKGLTGVLKMGFGWGLKRA